MLTAKAKDLRKLMKGQECRHPMIENEFDRGVRSEDFVCTRCGKVFFTREDWEKYRAERQLS